MKMSKCPACGYNLNKKYNISLSINNLLKVRTKKTIKYLNKIALRIIKNIPSEDRVRYFQFLFGIKSVNDEVIVWAIEQYYQGKYFNTGKGFPYLRKIIQNRNENVDVLNKNEKLMLGSTPPVINIEGEEDGKRNN
tara:strand:+ start:58 stop:465 length:408 start_codon:yes stop_codon:yes gene_type:complete